MVPPGQPDEPIVPLAVVARIDQLGWSADRYRLQAWDERRALISYDTVFEPYVLLSLRASLRQSTDTYVTTHAVGHGGTQDDLGT